MKTTKPIGLALIGLGVFALVARLLAPLLLRSWPLLIVGVGSAFILTAVRNKHNPKFGALYIPGLPIFTMGSLLLFTSLYNEWSMWASLWPLLILALGTAFVLAGKQLKNIWFSIPASILLINGLLFLFCAVTGWWEIWAVAWVAEPLAVGLGLLIAGTFSGKRGLVIASLILISTSGLGFAGMSLVMWSGANLIGAICLIGAGVFLLRQNKYDSLAKSEKEKLADLASDIT